MLLLFFYILGQFYDAIKSTRTKGKWGLWMINPLHPKPPTSIIKIRVCTCMWLVTHFLPSHIYLFKYISLKSSVTWAIGSCYFRSKTHEYLRGLLALWWACKAIRASQLTKIFLFWTLFVTAFVFYRRQNDKVLKMHSLTSCNMYF